MSDDLKPCPFCGCTMEMTYDGKYFVHRDRTCFGAHISIVATDFARIAAWNTRTLPAVRVANPTEAKLAKVVRALRFGLDLIEGEKVGTEWRKGQRDFRSKARAALAEIEAPLEIATIRGVRT